MRREIVPTDLSKIKTKVAFNLTRRQLICFGLAAIIGIPSYLLMRLLVGSSGATMLVMFLVMPCFLFGVYEKNGQPLEKYVRYVWRFIFQRPKRRPYQTRNLYQLLERQAALEEEVKNIVRSNQSKSTKNTGPKTHRTKVAAKAQQG